MTRKFIEGIQQYQRFWGESVTVYAEAEPSLAGDSLDNVALALSDLPFELQVLDYERLADARSFGESAIALASAGHRQNHVADLCRCMGLPCVYVTEYSLNTRCQIIDAETNNPLLRWRRRHWARRQERYQVAAIAISDGVQCNGAPTFQAYRQLSPSPLLYFDTRVTTAMLAKRIEVDDRLAHCLADRPLRLLFSGRLNHMKGADHLIEVARLLRDSQVNFVLTICGQGELLPSMRTATEALNLSNHVKFAGVLDFHEELLPMVKNNVDVFICCHRQGDPSCTYLETMSCGVPIVGYDNEAFAGLFGESAVGWVVPMNHPEAIAAKVASLASDRRAIATASHRALEFATKHTFDREFERRVEHLHALAARRAPI